MIKKISQKIGKINSSFLIIENSNKIEVSKHLPNHQQDYQQIQANIVKFRTKLMQIDTKIKNVNLNMTTLNLILDYVQRFQQKQINYHQKTNQEYAIILLDNDCKFSCILTFIDDALIYPDDIITMVQKNKNYELVKSKIKQIPIANIQKVRQNISKMGLTIMSTNAVILKEQQYSLQSTKSFMFSTNFLYYTLNNNAALIKSLNYYRKPDVKIAKQIWNLPDIGITEKYMAFHHQSIAQNRLIYVPRKILGQKEGFSILRNTENTIPIRILNHQKLDFYEQKVETCCPCAGFGIKKQKQTYQNIIIHFHGGGFIALSSKSTQSYTIRWANSLKIPVFSIDYRLSPQFPFPCALDDCYFAYQFILKNIYQYLNVKPKNIILAGESAGGNLVCSLMGLLLMNNITLPKSIYLIYPAVDLRNRFSPSRLYSLSDYILFSSLLLMCRQAYLGKENEMNPFVSPILLTQNFVNKNSVKKCWPLRWPKTQILVGKKDPLYDDTIRLTQKLVQSNIDCKTSIFEEFGHGVLSLDFAIPECQLVVKQSIEQLRSLLN